MNTGSKDTHFKRTLSNRESGDGRYDVLIERTTANYILNYIFEVKSCGADEDLDVNADEALAQIEKQSGMARIYKVQTRSWSR